jgi:hypothetical protein
MKVWIAFLLIAFLLGGWEFRNQKSVKFLVFFGMCVTVALALRSYRFV